MSEESFLVLVEAAGVMFLQPVERWEMDWTLEHPYQLALTGMTF
jgi:hypothetical protein